MRSSGCSDEASDAADANQCATDRFVGGHGVFKVTRALPDGHIDPDFGSRGVVTVRFGSNEAHPTSVAITRFGGIIVAGTVCSDSRTCHFGVARLHASGDLNPNFGDGGTTEINFPKP